MSAHVVPALAPQGVLLLDFGQARGQAVGLLQRQAPGVHPQLGQTHHRRCRLLAQVGQAHQVGVRSVAGSLMPLGGDAGRRGSETCLPTGTVASSGVRPSGAAGPWTTRITSLAGTWSLRSPSASPAAGRTSTDSTPASTRVEAKEVDMAPALTATWVTATMMGRAVVE